MGTKFLYLSILLFFPALTRAETLRICSQNLHRFNEKKNVADVEKQKNFLVSRMKRADCDVVAVQEVIGKNKREAEATIAQLARAWEDVLGEKVEAVVGESLDEYIRCGFLVRRGAGKIAAVKSFLDEPLPRLQPLGPAGRFLRPPVALSLDVPDDGRAKRFWIMNIHLKSRARGFQDPTGTDFELLRMEMAEAVKNIASRAEKSEPPGTVVVVTGDRNGDLSHAASRILSGERELEDFRRGGPCRLTEDEQPDCGLAPGRTPEFIGLFERRRELFPERSEGGSYMYRGRQELLDEISVRPEHFGLVERPGGRLGIGFEGQFYKGSDHKMVWAEFSF